MRILRIEDDMVLGAAVRDQVAADGHSDVPRWKPFAHANIDRGDGDCCGDRRFPNGRMGDEGL